MDRLRKLIYLLRQLDRRRAERELDEEISAHLELEIQQHRQDGMSEREARSAALRSFGNIPLIKERTREMWGLSALESCWQDVRYSVRVLRKRPGFTAVAVLTLALGIGANSAIFSLVDGVLLQPLPYPEPERLVTLSSNQSLPDLDDIKAQSQAFEDFGGVTTQALDFTGGAEPAQVQAALVNADLFGALGARPALGRVLTPQEDRYGGERVIVLSHGFWQRQLGADPSVLGRALVLSGNSYTVIGVMPPAFAMPLEDVDLWASLRVVNPLAAQFRGVHFLHTYLRLKPGVTVTRAQAEMQNIDHWLEQQYPQENKGRHTRLIPLQERLVGKTRPALLILFGAVGLVLLIACANFANLLLAHGAARGQELVIRAALGAGRWRLVRQVLMESAILSLLGGTCGLAVAAGSAALLSTWKPASLPRLSAIGVDGPVLAFTLGISILTGILVGLVPALGVSGFNLNESLKESGRGAAGSASRSRLRNILVVSEIALAFVLLIGAGLLIRDFRLLWSVDPGFDPANVLTARVELPEASYKGIPEQTQFRQRLLDGLNSLPGMEAAMVSELPLSGDYLTHNFALEGRPPVNPGEEPEVNVRSVGGEYFRTMKIALLRGRAFTAGDRPEAPTVGVVNESFARTFFPGQNPIGARIRWTAETSPHWLEIVGVVADVKHFGLNRPEEPAFYYSYAQLDQPWKRWMYLVVRGKGDPATIAEQVKSQVWQLDRQLPLTRVEPMTAVIAASTAAQRFNMLVLSIFSAMALLLAAVGIYGVISYSVAQRRHEIGIRMALGAQSRDVLKLILGHGLALTLAGLGLGLLGAFALTRVLSRLLYGLSATDPETFVLVSLLVVTAALLACALPARRAAKVDPMVALRYE